MNKALLTKVGCRLMNLENNWCNIVRVNYLGGESFYHALWTQALPQGSKIWNNLVHTQIFWRYGAIGLLGVVAPLISGKINGSKITHSSTLNSSHCMRYKPDLMDPSPKTISPRITNGLGSSTRLLRGWVLLWNFKNYLKMIGSPLLWLRTPWFGSLLPCGTLCWS